MTPLEILCILAAYFVGAIPFGLILSMGSGVDIRSQGSKNIGATNVGRLLGKKLGILTLLADITKGCTRSDRFNTDFQCPLCYGHNFLGTDFWCAYKKGLTAIAVPAIDDGGDIHINDITVFQFFLAWNTVTNHMID